MSSSPPGLRKVAAAVIGNALEWYDFVVFGFLTVIIAKLFFPAEQEYSALLLTTAWNMSEPHKWRGYWSAPASDRVLLLLTLALTVLADLTVAIGVGVGLGLALRLRESRLQAEEWHTPER